MAEIRILSSSSPDFRSEMDRLLAWETVSDSRINQTVDEVIQKVRGEGDAALIHYTTKFDGWAPKTAADLEISKARLEQAWNAIPESWREALRHSAGRIRAYAERQKMESWSFTESDGTLLGQQVTPLDRVGLYVPGGKAAYPSSVLMNAIPAKVAGVGELIMVVPTPKGELNELVLAAAHVSGVDRVFALGGAQAVAALAYGTETVPGVDKIVGPGNIYVATAKRAVFGKVGIDMIAGPSEILVVCDGGTDPDWVAMDLFAQAEHDELAQAILVTPDAAFLDAVAASMARQLEAMPRRRMTYRGRLIPAEGYLLTEKVPEAVGLPEAVRATRDPSLIRIWAVRLARIIRQMHDRGVSHRDLKAPNIMLQYALTEPTQATPVLIDLVGVRASSAAVPFARRAKELARLNASFLHRPHITRTERLRFLLAYLRAGVWEMDWKKWWRAVSSATLAKVEKNRRAKRELV